MCPSLIIPRPAHMPGACKKKPSPPWRPCPRGQQAMRDARCAIHAPCPARPFQSFQAAAGFKALAQKALPEEGHFEQDTIQKLIVRGKISTSSCSEECWAQSAMPYCTVRLVRGQVSRNRQCLNVRLLIDASCKRAPPSLGGLAGRIAARWRASKQRHKY